MLQLQGQSETANLTPDQKENLMTALEQIIQTEIQIIISAQNNQQVPISTTNIEANFQVQDGGNCREVEDQECSNVLEQQCRETIGEKCENKCDMVEVFFSFL